MPRRILARRFEPRYGVSQPMLDAESRYVGRELDDYLVLATADLKERLSTGRVATLAAQEELELLLNSLPDRERLALKVMLARDVFHIAKLYATFLRSSPAVADATGSTTPTAAGVDADEEPQPALVFRSSLFD